MKQPYKRIACIITFRIGMLPMVLSLLATACSQSQQLVQETLQLHTSTPIVAIFTTSRPTKSPVKSPTPLLTQPPINPTASMGPTTINSAANTHTPTPPEIPASYDLPGWFSNLNDYVFMMISDARENSNQISMVDANLITRFDITIPYPEIYGYFWTAQEGSFGFLASDFQTVYLVNAATGKVTLHTLHTKDADCLKAEAQERADHYEVVFAVDLGIASGSSPESLFFLCSGPEEPIQRDFVKRREGNHIIIIFNKGRLAGQSKTIQILDPKDELDVMGDYPYYDPDTGKAFLIVLKADLPDNEEEKAWYSHFGGQGSRIEIYQIIDGRKIASFDGIIDPDSILISPDFRQVIINAEITDGGKIPCFIKLENGQLNCLDFLRAQEHFEGTSLFGLSRDGKRLFLAENLNNRSDLCIYEILLDSFYCPTKKMEELNNLNIEWYRISQDEQFFLFEYGYSCPHCDYWGEPSSAVIRMDGKNLFFLGKEILLSDSPSYPFETILARPILIDE